MASTTFTCNKDSRVALSGATSLGAGASTRNPIGLYSGYKYRTLLGFSYSFSGMVSITAAVLYVKTSDQYYVGFGSDPDIDIHRITTSWSEGTSVSLSGSNAVEWSNQPSVSFSNIETLDVSTSENTWVSKDITPMMQDALAAGVFYGLSIWAVDETSGTDVTEIYGREYGSNDAYIAVTYTTNVAPSAPTGFNPNGGEITGITPTISFTHVDSDGDALLDYDLQVSTDSSFASVTHWNVAAQTAGIVANDVDRSYGGTGLTRGVTYYWRARTSASTGVLTEGAWCAAQSFKVAQLPTVTLTEPSAASRLLRTTYTAGAGWASPRLYVTWNFSCADAGTQYSYEVDVANDSGGSPGSSLYASGAVVSTAQTLTVPANLTEGNKYHVRVRAVCSHGETSSYSGYFIGRSRWGVALHRFDCGSAPTSWSISTLNTTTISTNAVVLEYGSNTTTTTPGTFYSSLGSAALNRYFFYRVYLLSWGASPATSASLDRLVLSYSANVLVPDKWTRSDTTNQVIDESTYVYGTQSLRINATGSNQTASQLVTVVPNTNYVLSGRIRTQGADSAGVLALAANSLTGAVVVIDVPAATSDWTRYSVSWNSGASTQIYVQCRSTGGTVGDSVWFDALKLEASAVVTPWTPSFLGQAVVLDAGGLQIDGSAGGIFRLRGSSGGTRDRVDLGANGLTLGGDVPVYSGAAGKLTIGDGGPNTGLKLDIERAWQFEQSGSGSSAILQLRNLVGDKQFQIRAEDGGEVLLNAYARNSGNGSRVTIGSGTFLYSGGSSFPSTPTTYDHYYRTDIGMEFVYNGTRWLSSQLMTAVAIIGITAGATIPYTATTSAGINRAHLNLLGGSDIWLEDVFTNFYVSGGTALSGSHKWDHTIQRHPSGTTIGSGQSIASGSSNAWRQIVTALDSLMSSTDFVIDSTWTKTGTPGNLYAFTTYTYRIVAT